MPGAGSLAILAVIREHVLLKDRMFDKTLLLIPDPRLWRRSDELSFRQHPGGLAPGSLDDRPFSPRPVWRSAIGRIFPLGR